MNDSRIPVFLLVLSALGFTGLALNEGYTEKAVIPVKGDPPTIGLGSTRRDDGSPVQVGDKITPPAAIRRAVRDIGGKEAVLRTCFGEYSRLHQHEWDAFVDLGYNVGPAAVCRSSIVKKVKAGEYAAACQTILDFKKAHGRNCSLPENHGFCGGVWIRRQQMTHLCLTGEYPK